MFAYWIISILLTFGVINPTVSNDAPGSKYCDFYNDKSCSGSQRQCVETEKCIPEDPYTTNYCFVTWHLDNSTNAIKVLGKGCFLSGKECYQPTCVDKSDFRRRNVFFCCCHGDMCNKNFTWAPRPTDSVKIEEVTPTSGVIPNEYLIIVWPVSLPGIVIITIIGILCWCLKQQTSKHSLFSKSKKSNSKASHAVHPCLETVRLLEMKARGHFGGVWKAQMSDNIVAAKVFSIHREQSWQTEQEVFTLPQMKHRDLLEFIGIQKKDDSLQTELWLITAYHEKGSLSNYLRSNVLSWTELCRIAESMVRGLVHLHEEIPGKGTAGFKPSVAHRDLKSQNILLKSDMTTCIADFGLSLIFHRDKITGCKHSRVGTRRYMAPEVLQGAIDFNRDSFLRIDMYACGLVLWELVSRCAILCPTLDGYRLPFEDEVGGYPTLDDMLNVVVYQGKRPLIYNWWRSHPGLLCLCETMEECWDLDSEARPSAHCILERIRALNRPDDGNSTTRIFIDGDDPVALKNSYKLNEEWSIDDKKEPCIV